MEYYEILNLIISLSNLLIIYTVLGIGLSVAFIFIENLGSIWYNFNISLPPILPIKLPLKFIICNDEFLIIPFDNGSTPLDDILLQPRSISVKNGQNGIIFPRALAPLSPISFP